jgi:glutamate dehydrogenase
MTPRNGRPRTSSALARISGSARNASRAIRSCVYNPTFDQDGYDSTHTIVDIVTDDMPFLVDSVG